MATKEQSEKIKKDTLAFIFTRNAADEEFDLDKRKHVKTNARKEDYSDAVLGFSGEHQCFLPSYNCRVMSRFDGRFYPSFEHALLVEKYRQADIAEQIMRSDDIVELKRSLIKSVYQNEEQVEEWKARCLGVAEVLLRDKFVRDKGMKQVLMNTTRKPLYFVNEYKDRFWGVDENKSGQNHLGKLLEQVRLELQRGTAVDAWIATCLALQDPGYVNISVTARKLSDDSVTKANDDSFVLNSRSVFTVGQAPNSDVWLRDKSISRSHAVVAVQKEGNRVFLVDLESSNGTEANGVKLSPYLLTEIPLTSVVTFGALPIEYRFANAIRSVVAEEAFQESLATLQREAEAAAVVQRPVEHRRKDGGGPSRGAAGSGGQARRHSPPAPREFQRPADRPPRREPPLPEGSSGRSGDNGAPIQSRDGSVRSPERGSRRRLSPSPERKAPRRASASPERRDSRRRSSPSPERRAVRRASPSPERKRRLSPSPERRSRRRTSPSPERPARKRDRSRSRSRGRETGTETSRGSPERPRR